jgi:polyhydroxybutyrate depolymerase
MHRLLCVASTLLIMACGSSASTSGTASTGSAPTSTGASGDGGASVSADGRTSNLHVPPGYVAGHAAPLVVMLHGTSVDGLLEELYLGFGPLSDKYGFLYAYPDGTLDQQGMSFWNATDACCNYDGSTVDDSGYLSALIDAIKAQYTVDPKRVFVIGHSNGGFMAYRMACDHADQIAAIASLAGAMWEDTTKCQPSEPVSVLEIHGTSDAEVIYAGAPGSGKPGDGEYPSAETTVEDWATFDGCGTSPDKSSPQLDIDSGIAGPETTVESFEQGCKSGSAVALWSIEGGSHLPAIGDTFREGVVQFLLAHPKP